MSDAGPRAARSGGLGARIVSALVLAPAALICVWLGGLAFTILVGIAAGIMAYEWNRLSQPAGAKMLAGISAAALLGLALGAWAEWPALLIASAAGGLGAVALAAKAQGGAMRWPVLGLLYCAAPSVALVWLRGRAEGLHLVLWIFLLVWAVDIGAYAVGRTIGGPKLAPRISPGKTWSGLCGGAAAGALAAATVGWALGLGSFAALALLGAGLSCLEQASDLVESAFKRRWHAKDAGHLIPGHGGLLDRLDGLLAVAPVVALLVWWRLAHGAIGLL